eukprot:731041-Amphidinium_carterae.1
MDRYLRLILIEPWLGAFRSMLTVFRCVTGDCNYSDGTPVILELVEKYGVPAQVRHPFFWTPDDCSSP